MVICALYVVRLMCMHLFDGLYVIGRRHKRLQRHLVVNAAVVTCLNLNRNDFTPKLNISGYFPRMMNLNKKLIDKY